MGLYPHFIVSLNTTIYPIPLSLLPVLKKDCENYENVGLSLKSIRPACNLKQIWEDISIQINEKCLGQK